MSTASRHRDVCSGDNGRRQDYQNYIPARLQDSPAPFCYALHSHFHLLILKDPFDSTYMERVTVLFSSSLRTLFIVCLSSELQKRVLSSLSFPCLKFLPAISCAVTKAELKVPKRHTGVILRSEQDAAQSVACWILYWCVVQGYSQMDLSGQLLNYGKFRHFQGI